MWHLTAERSLFHGRAPIFLLLLLHFLLKKFAVLKIGCTFALW